MEMLRFASFEIDSPQHLAVKEWLTANDIPISDVPMSARMVVTPGCIQIEMFDRQPALGHKNPQEHRFISIAGGFAKRERTFRLVKTPEECGVELVPLDIPAWGQMQDVS